MKVATKWMRGICGKMCVPPHVMSTFSLPEFIYRLLYLIKLENYTKCHLMSLLTTMMEIKSRNVKAIENITVFGVHIKSGKQ
jgi:hypothetical protein